MAPSTRSVVIHGHFYQPPRDDPWLEAVEAEPSAAPFHDWNERVTEECYRAVVAARIPGEGGRIAKIVNTLEFISFDFGPTLLEWMEANAPTTYRAILEADAISSRRNRGFGNAIAQAYHHTILPLASEREKVSEVRWGIADFRRRFGRDPIGMWLPETAVDGATLEVLAREGIAFTILAPHQVEVPPPRGLPGLYRTSGGRSVALFVYDGPLSQGVAFGSLLDDADKWVEHLLRPSRDLVSMATDGETYGHHHRFGEMALAATLQALDLDQTVRVENFASFLSRNPARHEVKVVEPSSWSCPHGVERWRSDCGCRTDTTLKTHQAWRSGLRDAVEWLAAQLHQVYLTEGAPLLGDPWAARDRHGASGDSTTTDTRALELLEMERQALRLFISCGWFFDDLAGLEPIQILRHAARGLELVGPMQNEIKEGFLKRLDTAQSNESPPRSGRAIFLDEAKPRVPAHLRVAAGAALWDSIHAVPNPTAKLSGGLPQGDSMDGGETTPGVPGYKVEKVGQDTFLVSHGRTGRSWRVEARVDRPSSGRGAVAVRVVGEPGENGEELLPLKLREIPEGFRFPITNALHRRVPDLGQALTAAVLALEEGIPSEIELDSGKVERILKLVDIHILLDLPIPFDAQTAFYAILQGAGPEVAAKLAPLREPLGFTPAPRVQS